jgi:apolipoprotein N-acyltransferase
LKLFGLPARLGLAALSGVATAFAFPNISFVPLLAVCLLPLLVALAGLRLRYGALVGAVYGFAFWVAVVPWVAFTVHRFGDVPRVLAVIALLLMAALMTPPFALFGALVSSLDTPRVSLRLALIPAAWVLQEAFRTDYYYWGGFPWALLSYPLAKTPALVQSAALGGAWLTSALVVAVNVAVLEGLLSRGGRRLLWIGGAGGAVALVWVLGAFSMQRYDTPAASTRRLRIGVLQPNVAQEIRFTGESKEEIWRALVEETRVLVAKEHPRLVLWPESAVPYAWSFTPHLREELPALCKELDVAILFSTIWSDHPEDDEAPYYNAALLVTKDGPVLPAYFKQHLVPFGEYVPAARLLKMIKPISRAVPGGFTPGTRAEVIRLRAAGARGAAEDGPPIKLAGAVCYEIVYPSVARDGARAGADVLFTLTNDAWYGALGAREQHFEAAVFRAVETGLPLVRAAVTGISGWIDEHGRVLAWIGPDEKGSFVADLALPKEPVNAPAVRLATPFLAVCAAAWAARILQVWRGRDRRTGAARKSTR